MITVSQKIKVAVPHVLRSQMEMDVEDYGLKGIGDLCNRILAQYAEFPEPDAIANSDALYKTVPPLQFSLSKSGESFASFANSQDAATAALCRHYFECYVNLPRGKRECFIFGESLDKLKKAIESRVNVNLLYRGERKNVAPCFIAFSPSQVRTYIVVCDGDTSKDIPERFHSLRLCHIKGVALDTKSQAFHCASFELSHQAETFREHFDPFLCYGQSIKARLTEKGVERYNRLTTNRPKVIARDGTECSEVNEAATYTFECSEKLAKIYFPQFLSDADILEPRELRLWFKEQFDNAAKVYTNPSPRP